MARLINTKFSPLNSYTEDLGKFVSFQNISQQGYLNIDKYF